MHDRPWGFGRECSWHDIVVVAALHQFPNKVGACLVIFLRGMPRLHFCLTTYRDVVSLEEALDRR